MISFFFLPFFSFLISFSSPWSFSHPPPFLPLRRFERCTCDMHKSRPSRLHPPDSTRIGRSRSRTSFGRAAPSPRTDAHDAPARSRPHPPPLSAWAPPRSAHSDLAILGVGNSTRAEYAVPCLGRPPRPQVLYSYSKVPQKADDHGDLDASQVQPPRPACVRMAQRVPIRTATLGG